jgi:hypothetical protein
MRSLSGGVAVCVGLAIFASAEAAAAQHDHHGGPAERLGTVDFPTSCGPATRAAFDRAVALLHSFEFRDAIGGFDGVLAADPGCAMAHWGRALAFWGNPFAPGVKGGTLLQDGRAAAEAARATGLPTPRERAYIDAVSELYRDTDAATQRARVLAYAQAMERLSREYPGDMEATIFYALAVTQTALPTDKTYAQQLKAVTLLEPLFATHPDHPGLAHYIIHACDHPPLAARALEASRRYAKIAPSAPHALHMPSHTFTRVGAVAGIDRVQHRVGRQRREDRQLRGGAARDGLRDVRVPADRAGRGVPARARSGAGRGRQARARCRDRSGPGGGGVLRPRRHPRALRARTRRVGRCGGPARRALAGAIRRCDHPFCTRDWRGA